MIKKLKIMTSLKLKTTKRKERSKFRHFLASSNKAVRIRMIQGSTKQGLQKSSQGSRASAQLYQALTRVSVLAEVWSHLQAYSLKNTVRKIRTKRKTRRLQSNPKLSLSAASLLTTRVSHKAESSLKTGVLKRCQYSEALKETEVTSRPVDLN